MLNYYYQLAFPFFSTHNKLMIKPLLQFNAVDELSQELFASIPQPHKILPRILHKNREAAYTLDDKCDILH